MSAPCYKYKLIIAYKGTSYKGWQIQPNHLSIQEVIEGVLARLFQRKLPIVGAGRTDSGVHALGQVAHLEIEKPQDTEKLQKSLNALLPPDIRILEIEPVDSSFHARFSAKEKIYSYTLSQGPVHHPFHRYTSLYYPYALSEELIREAIPHFLGTRNFKAFANQAFNPEKNYVKTLRAIEITNANNFFSFTFYGDGFLYKMVRNLTATLVEVGRGRLSPQAINAIFISEDRRKCPAVLPPEGLTLIKVVY